MVDLTSYVLPAAKLLQQGEPVKAGKVAAEALKLHAGRVLTEEHAYQVLNPLLDWCLNTNRYALAAQLCWGSNRFSSDPHFSKLVFKAWQNYDSMLFMGAASSSKSFSSGVWLLLDWRRDPEYTDVKLVGPSEQHLKDNLFTHMVQLHRESFIPMPGQVGDLFIGLDPRARKSAISGVVIPIGRGKAAGRLQGAKRMPRKQDHPMFGRLSRMRIFLDEVENIQPGVWADIDNVFANLDPDDPGGFKIAGAFNPVNPASQVGVRAAPPGGWDTVDIESMEEWESERGWHVVRLDAMKCENVIRKRVIFPGLQTYGGVQRIIKNSGGVNSPGYFTMVRAMYPPSGAKMMVVPAHVFTGIRGEVVWYDNPKVAAGVDVALEGGDAPKMAIGRFGLAVSVKYPRSLVFPEGHEEFFTDEHGSRRPRYMLQLDTIFSLKSANTVEMARQIMEHCKAFRIQPDWCMLDRTGNGAGVHDLLKTIWSSAVRGVNYTENPSEQKILADDTETPKETYDRIMSEIWFAASRWMEYGYVKFSPMVDISNLQPQLTGRMYLSGRKIRVESKPDYKSRNAGQSPDEADAYTLLIHAVRMASGFMPGVATPGTQELSFDGEPECWVGCTDRLEDGID